MQELWRAVRGGETESAIGRDFPRPFFRVKDDCRASAVRTRASARIGTTERPLLQNMQEEGLRQIGRIVRSVAGLRRKP
jgi:hypothetical protein